MPRGGTRKGAGRKPGPKKIRMSVYVLPETWDKLGVIGGGSQSAGIEFFVGNDLMIADGETDEQFKQRVKKEFIVSGKLDRLNSSTIEIGLKSTDGE